MHVASIEGSFPLVMLSHPTGASELTAAEIAVVTGVLQGKSNAELARVRKTTLRTVAKQVESALRKLGVRSRSELAAAWIEP